MLGTLRAIFLLLRAELTSHLQVRKQDGAKVIFKEGVKLMLQKVTFVPAVKFHIYGSSV